jgi:uroporphyrinogen decarboxylase
VPVDLWGSASRINTQLYRDIIEAVGIREPGPLIRPGSDTEYEDYALADLVGSDFRHINIGKPANFKSYKNEKGFVIDEWGIGRSLVGRYPTIVHFPLAGATMETLDTYKWPVARDPGRIAGIGEWTREYYEKTDKAITATSAHSGNIFDICQYLMGTEEFFISIYEEPEFCRRLIDIVTDYLVELNEFYLEPIARYLEWVEFTSDFGSQNAPFISVKMFRDFFKEPYTRLFGSVKEKYPGLKVFLHSCGSVFDLIGEFIDCGADIINPLQPLAHGMDSAVIKKTYGDRAVFHGGFDIQDAINGSLEDVRADVLRCMRTLAPGGGYIFSHANHIQYGAPVENVLAMFNFAREYGRYPIS